MSASDGWLRGAVRTGAALAVGVAAGQCWYHVSVQPGARAIATMFDALGGVTPPADFDDTRRNVKVWPTARLDVHGAPPARLVVYTPRRGGRWPTVLWVHGGGYIAGSTAQVAEFAVLLASQGYAVACLGYSLAPATRYPAPVRQGNAALAHIAARIADYGGDPDRIFVGGDSAGAQIASQLAAVQVNPGLARELGLSAAVTASQLRGAVLYCGIYDMSTVGATGFPVLRTSLWAYTGHRDWTSAPFIAQLSTTEQVTPAYPPAFITVGDNDPLESQAEELARAMKASGVSTETLFWTGTGAGLGHQYQYDYSLPQATEAFRRTVGFLERNSAR